MWEVVCYDWMHHKDGGVIATFDNEDDAKKHADSMDALALRCFTREKEADVR